MKFIAAGVLAGLIVGCSGVPATPTSSASSGAYSATSGSLPNAATKCHMKITMKPNGGFVKLPTCSGFSGKMAYPKSPPGFTATITVSAKPLPHVYYNWPDTVYYMSWVFTNPSYPKGSSVVFSSTVDSSHDGCIIKGPFKASSQYWAVFEDPTSNQKKPHDGLTIGGTTQGHAVLGIPFPGTNVLTGAKNFVLFTSKEPQD